MSRERTAIAVDARMIGASGIGTYLSELLPRVLAARPYLRFALLGPAARLREVIDSESGNVRFVDLDVPIYSVREQIALTLRTPGDAIVFWSPHYNIPLGWRGRLVVTVHDVAHLALPHLFGGPHRQAYARFMLGRVCRAASAILTPSEFTRKELLRLAGRPRHRPDVVPGGVSQDWFTVASSPRPYPDPYLLYVGNVKPHKNLSRLLEAFRGLAPRILPDLLIIGQHEGLRTIDSEVLEAAGRLGDRVKLLGAVPQDLLRRYVAHAEALVFPSLYEGFGLPPLEAMACGRPAIVSRAASLPEVCGDAACYFDPTDSADIALAIRRVMEDAELRETLRCKGLERARRFTWERTAEATLSVLDRVLAA